jgi:predicted porin
VEFSLSLIDVVNAVASQQHPMRLNFSAFSSPVIFATFRATIRCKLRTNKRAFFVRHRIQGGSMKSIQRPFRRSAIAAALASLALGSTVASAQTANVTLYGVIDVGVTHASGVKGGRVTQVSSGIMEGTRIGIRGTEDIGGGLKATFTAEMRIEGDTGGGSNRPFSGNQLPERLTAGLPLAVQAALTNVAVGPSLGVNLGNRLFDRQVFVGLITPVGAILAGRQYTPAFEITNRYDAFANATAASPGQLLAIPAGLDIRADNSLLYRIEKDGFYGGLMYGAGESALGTKNGSLIAANAGYQSGRFGAGVGYNERRNSAGQKALNSFAVGANFNAGFANFFALGAQVNEPNPGSGPELRAGLIAAGVPALLVDTGILPRLQQDVRLYHVGARIGLGVGTLTLGYSKADDRRNTDADSQSYGALYTYPLSKRTDINLAFTQVKNDTNSQVACGGNGFLGGVTASAGKDADCIQFSLRHKF